MFDYATVLVFAYNRSETSKVNLSLSLSHSPTSLKLQGGIPGGCGGTQARKSAIKCELFIESVICIASWIPTVSSS